MIELWLIVYSVVGSTTTKYLISKSSDSYFSYTNGIEIITIKSSEILGKIPIKINPCDYLGHQWKEYERLKTTEGYYFLLDSSKAGKQFCQVCGIERKKKLIKKEVTEYEWEE